MIVIDDHSGVCDPKTSSYIGLNASTDQLGEMGKAQRAQVSKQYCELFFHGARIVISPE